MANSEPSKYLVVLGHFDQMGGAERQAFHLIRYLRERRGAKVAVLGWYGTNGTLAGALREWGCEIFSFPYRETGSRLAKGINLLQLAAFVRRNIRPDYILPFVALHSKPICQIWRLTGAKYAWWNQQDEGRGLYGSKAERKALLNAVHITSNSHAGADFISRTYLIPKERLRIYNNGTDIPDPAGLKPTWRNELGISSTTPLVSMVANLTAYKDHQSLLRAWAIVKRKLEAIPGPGPVLALAGYLSQSHIVDQLKILAFDLNLGSSVRFLGSIDTTNELMWESDLVVHSSVTEGCPNAVCEAMALGKAVIATDIPGTRQAIASTLWEQCLSAPRDPECLADLITRHLLDEELRNRAGRLNQQRIENEFTVEGMCEFFMQLMGEQEAISGSAVQRP